MLDGPDVSHDKTESVESEGRLGPGAEWTLIVAFDCQAPTVPPLPIVLSGVNEVAVGRGPERRFSVAGSTGRLDCPDRWMSRRHARLVRAGEVWSLEDGGSRNGTRLNGEPVGRKSLEDGDTLECGGTFLVLRRLDRRPFGFADSLACRPEALRTASPALARELGIVPKIAQGLIPVLVLGESGTGKEGIASAIHALSGRGGAFVALNCGAIPATLVESELFGTRRGAFSGAEDRPGIFRNAERGTLFLDEICELPLPSQAALLRVLQQKEMTPLGSCRPIAVDVRIVAATNRAVKDEIAAGRFRRDLYARLCSYELQLPPLRERREDLGLLVATFIARHDRSGVARTLSRDAVRALFAYDWPNNIRQLEQVMSAALAVAEGEIGAEHLRTPVRDAGMSSSLESLAGEPDLLIATIRRHRGNMSAVARALSTSRSQLYRLLHRQSIRPRDRATET